MSRVNFSSVNQQAFFFSVQVNDVQTRIKETTRKMMALVSELSMNQANAMKLQQELRMKEANLEQCYMRMEKGEAPSEEADREWLKLIRDEMRRINDIDERKNVSQRF